MQAASISSLFLLPWVLVYFKVDEGSYRIVAPVKLGLYYCYSEICLQYPSVYFTPFLDPRLASEGMEPSKLQLPGLYPQKFQQLEFPFFVTSVITGLILTLSTLTCVLNVAIFVFTLLRSAQEHAESFDRCRVLLSLSTLLSSIAAVSYIAITTRLLDGGKYLEGLWVVLVSAVLGVICSYLFYSLDDKDKGAYSPIEDEEARPFYAIPAALQ